MTHLPVVSRTIGFMNMTHSAIEMESDVHTRVHMLRTLLCRHGTFSCRYKMLLCDECAHDIHTIASFCYRVIVVTFREKIAVFDGCTFRERIWITSKHYLKMFHAFIR